MTISFTLAIAAFLLPSSNNESWSQWRGPSRDGQYHGPVWPDELEGFITETWSSPLGKGYSGPIITENSVITVETRDEKSEVVRALDRTTGELLWESSWEGAMSVPFFAAKNGSWVRSTPAWDGDSIYVAGMRDVLTCLDAENGEERWRIDFVEDYSTQIPSFGCVCSPLIHGDFLYIQAGGGFVKINKKTGESMWRVLSDGGGMDSAFSSPVVAILSGKEQLLVQSRTDLHGIDIDSGDSLWTHPVKAFRGMNILTPTVFEESVLTSSYGGGTQLISIEPEGKEFAVSAKWNHGAQGYMTSPVIVDHYAYIFLRSQRFACFDLLSGERAWISPPLGDDYWSMIAQGDRILALTDNGQLHLIEANPEEYSMIDSLQVSDSSTWAHLAMDGNQIFIRELEGLKALKWE